MSNPLISHIEIPSTDLTRSSEFFKKVFNWEFKPFGNGYLLFNNHQGIMAGLRKVESVVKGDSTVFHVTIDNLEQILEKAISAGGHIKTGKTTIPAMGWYAVIFDLDGNSIGLYQKSS
ncbi:MAG: VOC family protein [Ignavibacteriota bacterium]|jgi:predicted enzyme related to lactoylglutathione lyase|nr:MAG: VOC family protein [Chlorobiota bacterium]MBE7476727.1 VOC family protein [Ignavibacteriales bacterium]MBL1122021.1 VOC family protein [Ignavibacteriota bacterium]MCC7093314.1 VOC family protein [Ignavibacteriaceae bacterium]MCE7856125.1 VOC family protein [Ignavibacteria bacterium CHB3]MEB2297583.1 VOC family protein [Ignavibacteria bacterium]